MKEVIEFESHVDRIKAEAQTGDIIRLVGTSAVGWTVLAGTAATPLGLMGLGLGAAATLWQTFYEAQKTGTALRWVPSFGGYGWEFLTDVLEENPRYEAIAQLYEQFGGDAIKRYLNQFQGDAQSTALARLIDMRQRLNAKLESADSDDHYDRVEQSGLEKIRRIVLGDDETVALDSGSNETVEPLGNNGSTDSPLFDWTELQRFPNRFPHLLLLGKTGAGKTTLAEALLELLPGDRLVITPHHKPNDFPGIKVIGKGRDYPAILMALQSLEREMQSRYERYAQGYEDFDWLNVCIDEFPAITANCGKEAGELMMVLAREARKVRIRLLILSQGFEVKALGIEGQGSIRECFTFIRLRGFVEDHAKRLKNEKTIQFLSSQVYPCMVEEQAADTSVLASLEPVEPMSNKRSIPIPVSVDEVTYDADFDTSWYVPQLPGVVLSDEASRLYGWMIRKRPQNPHGYTVRILSQGKPLGRNFQHTAECLQPIISELLGQALVLVDASSGLIQIR